MRRVLVSCLAFFVMLAVTSAAAVSAAAADDAAGGVAHSETDGAGHEAGDAHADGEVPLHPDVDLALWSLVVFLLFLTILRLAVWPLLSDGLNRREAHIRQDIAAAETARIKAEQMLAEHARKLEKVQDEVREILAEARRDAEYTKQDIIATAQRESEVTKQRAVAEINRARDQALHELFELMANRVVVATEHVLGRSLNGADQDRLIEEALAEMSTGDRRI